MNRIIPALLLLLPGCSLVIGLNELSFDPPPPMSSDGGVVELEPAEVHPVVRAAPHEPPRCLLASPHEETLVELVELLDEPSTSCSSPYFPPGFEVADFALESDCAFRRIRTAVSGSGGWTLTVTDTGRYVDELHAEGEMLYVVQGSDSVCRQRWRVRWTDVAQCPAPATEALRCVVEG